jgi:predicted DNA-binding ribbon-helix-helix protein
MPEKGWYSLTVRLSIARMIREIAKDKELTVDELLNELTSTIQSKKWLTCSLCWVKAKSTNMSSHMVKMHPR